MNRPDNNYIQTTRWVLVAVSVIALLAVLWAVRSILLLMLAAVILAVLFNLPVRFLARFNVRRSVAVVVAIVLSFTIVSLLARVALPTLLDQFTTLTTTILPNGLRQLIERFNSGEMFEQTPILRELVEPFGDQIVLDPDIINDLLRQLATSLGQIGVSVLPVVGDLASTVLSVLIVIFLSLYLLIDPDGYREGVIRLFPVGYRGRVSSILERVNFVLRAWLETTFISMVFVGVGTWIGLALLGIEQAAALGVLAGVLSFVPNFGQLVAVLAAIVVGVIQAPANLGWIVVVIYGVSLVQSQVLVPLILAGNINLPPVLVLLGQIACGALFGFLGILLAVPITAILMVLTQEVYIKDILGDTRPIGKLTPASMPAAPPPHTSEDKRPEISGTSTV